MKRLLATFILLSLLMFGVPLSAADGGMQEPDAHAFLPGWTANQGGSFTPSCYSNICTPFDYDENGSLYFVATGSSGSWFNNEFSPSQRGFHLLKIDASGSIEWTETIRCQNYCSNADDYRTKVLGVHVVGADQLFVVLSVYNEYLTFDGQQYYMSNTNLVTAFYENGSWAWVESRSTDGYAYNSLRFHGLDEADNLYVATLDSRSGSWQPYSISSFSRTGGNWLRTLEVPYSSPAYNYYPVLMDADQNGLHVVVTSTSVKYDFQTTTCAAGGESGACHIWLHIGQNGVKSSTTQAHYTSMFFEDIAVESESLVLLGRTLDYFVGSNTESNFTGQKISHSPNYAKYVAVLNKSGSWDSHVVLQKSSSGYFSAGLVDIMQDGDFLVFAVMDGVNYIDGTLVTRHSNVDAEYVMMRISSSGGLVWSNSLGFDNPSAYPAAAASDGDTVAFQFTHPSNGYAVYTRNGTDVTAPSGSTNYDVLWMDLEDGNIVDVESTSSVKVVARSPEGGVLVVPSGAGFVNYFMPDADGDNVGTGDNCPNTFNPTQADYNQDGDGDACDNDDDSDTILDASDSCPVGDLGWTSDDLLDHDGDGCKDATEDFDDDNDGHSDVRDACPTGITGALNDYDGDGCKDSEDADDDGDQIRDESDICAMGDIDWSSGTLTDHDSDGCQDTSSEDEDDDNDGIPDSIDQCPKGEVNWPSNINTDFDGDGCRDGLEDEDDDGDGIVNSIDDCPRSVGSVNANGCSATQAIESESGSSVVYYVCPTGSLVVLDPADCPDEPAVNVSADEQNIQNEFYFVCPGGSDVVTDLSDCPDGNIASNDGEVQLVIDPNSNNSEGYIVCPDGSAIVLDPSDCPTNRASDASGGGLNADAGVVSDGDGLLLVFMGGTFLMSAVAVGVVLFRKPQAMTSNFASIEAADYLLTQEASMAKTSPPLLDSLSPSMNTMAPPSQSLAGVLHGGQEWLEWPEGSDQHWYRAPESGGAWSKFEA